MKDIWNIIAAIAGVLAVAVAVIVLVDARSEQRMRLKVELLSQVTPNISGSTKKFEILYEGRKIPNYSILQYRISNPGGRPIRSADYEKPLELKFEQIDELLSADQISSHPHSLTVQVTLNQHTVEFSNALLNPDDWYIAEVVVVPSKDETASAKPSVRIAGVKEIEFTDVPSTPSRDRQLSARSRWVMVTQAILVSMMIGIQLWRQKQ